MLRTAVVLTLVCTAPALAGVTATGPFNGQAYETFEGVASPGGYPGPLAIFGGAATLDDSLSHTVVIAFNWFGPSGEVLPYAGNLMGGIPAGTAIFNFANPIMAFGGYMNTVGLVGGGTAVFRDADGSIIDTVAFDGSPVTWTWAGWTSDVAFSTVELTGANGPGFGFQFDNLTYSAVPAPGAVALLGLGALGATRRRRA